MNNSELNQWIRYHAEHFGEGFDRYIAPEAVMRTYRDELQYVALTDAKSATKRMMGDEAQQPMGWHKHLATVKRLANEAANQRHASQPKRKFIDGQEVFDCAFCKDTGMVTILAPRFVEAVRRGLINREPFDVPSSSKMAKCDNWRWGWFYSRHAHESVQIVKACTFVVACCCYSGKPANLNNAVFEPDKHYTGGIPASRDELANFEAHVQSLNELQPANYIAGFDDGNWN